jgi:formate-dependent nitrite reductase membrane component NrfD
MLDIKSKRILIHANIIMIITTIIHDADHVRQALCWNYTIGLELWLVNMSVYIPCFIALALTLNNKNSAAFTTSFSGIFIAACFLEVHLWRPTVPVWGLWNDNFFILGADIISWTILVITAAVGFGVGMAGFYVSGRMSVLKSIKYEELAPTATVL